jgi:two-component system OmpR family response regulator
VVRDRVGYNVHSLRRELYTVKAPKGRILVADDDPSLRHLLKTALEHLGYAVKLCNQGSSALKVAVSGSFDLLLLDYEMGFVTGFDVLKTLRSHHLQVPVILMSSHLPEAVRKACTRIPNTSVLHKPFSLLALRRKVARHLARRS